jgi:acyl-CoA reductase-like NAD-dependent aldehyde dehydrogenase
LTFRHIPRAVSNFRFFAGNILYHEERSSDTDGIAINYTIRQPVGVAGLISPWNLPLYLLTWYLCAVLLCCCALLLRVVAARCCCVFLPVCYVCVVALLCSHCVLSIYKQENSTMYCCRKYMCVQALRSYTNDGLLTGRDPK